MHKEEYHYLAAFARTQVLSPRASATLINACDSLETAWHASAQELTKTGISEELALKLCSVRETISPEHERALIEKHDIQVITLHDAAYPPLLKEINDPPVALFVRGMLHTDMSHPVSIVGTRAITSYGRQVLETVIPPLVSAGCSIISGLALGCDGRAHEETLTHGGYTIGVLGSGCDDDSIYPRYNYGLGKRILAQGGALISEYPPETKPEKYHFPTRNRIIAGLSKGVLVAEAAIASGSLITARLALDYNRNVYAVPGSIFSPQSAGTHELITLGARLVSSAADILEDLGIENQEKQTSCYTPRNEQERLILQLLSSAPRHLEDLAEHSHLSIADLLTCLTILETKRIVEQMEPGRYTKKIEIC